MRITYFVIFIPTILVVSCWRPKRAVGGRPAEIKDYPFMASLRTQFTLTHFCGGSIIDVSWILTAAHCIPDSGVQYIKVVVGFDVLDYVSDAPELYLAVKTGYRHPKYSSNIQQSKNDIGLIQLEEPLSFSETVKPIRLGKIPYDGVVRVVAAGWGRHQENQRIHHGDKLRSLEMTTLSAKPCQIIHATKNNLIDGKTQICAIASMGKSLCNGDSGAPLIHLEDKRQIGVFSGFETCTGEFPTVHARVEPYLGWINSLSKLNLTLS